MKKLRKVSLLLLSLAVIGGLTACGSTTKNTKTDDTTATETASATAAESTEESTEQTNSTEQPRKIVIGTEGAYAPYNLVNDAGEPDGYDIAVAKAVDELIPEVEFEYVATGWDGIFTALESGKIDVIDSECGYNEERAAKYLFPDVPYNYSTSAIIFKKGRTDIIDISSLTGLTVTAGTGSANTTWLENYNSQNGNPIKISYSDGDVSKMLQEIIDGRADATLNSPVTTALLAKEQGLEDQIDYVIWADNGISPTYWLYRNDEDGQWLKPLVDKALQTLLDNGTLSDISIKYLGADYSTEAAVKAQAQQ